MVAVEKKAITQTSEFIGRIQAIDRVDLTARVTAFVQERLFTEGTEVKQGDLLYRLERAPFEAAVQQQAASGRAVERPAATTPASRSGARRRC